MTSLAESIIYDPKFNTLHILNQLLLPSKVDYEEVKGANDAWKAIKEMKVRGAPAIAILGLLSVRVELRQKTVLDTIRGDTRQLLEWLKEKATHLCSSRPTAVNIRKEFDALIKLVSNQLSLNFDQLVDLICDYCFNMLENDRRTNKSIGDHGAKDILEKSCSGKVRVLTHCNTGSLATAGYGTALGVIRSLHSEGRLERAYCTETRPYNQGARLTAWELTTERIPSTLICDNMVASLMASRKIDAVVVGADRVVANGDTANKIGTYQIAILCKHFGVPFYVASPISTLDFAIDTGALIPIENRSANEMKFVATVQIAPTDMDCWNPAFDVTPAHLITGGIITEQGVFKPDQLAILNH